MAKTFECDDGFVARGEDDERCGPRCCATSPSTTPTWSASSAGRRSWRALVEATAVPRGVPACTPRCRPSRPRPRPAFLRGHAGPGPAEERPPRGEVRVRGARPCCCSRRRSPPAAGHTQAGFEVPDVAAAVARCGRAASPSRTTTSLTARAEERHRHRPGRLAGRLVHGQRGQPDRARGAPLREGPARSAPVPSAMGGPARGGDAMSESIDTAARERLEALVGTWVMEADLPTGRRGPARRRMTFTWFEQAPLLVQRWRDRACRRRQAARQ